MSDQFRALLEGFAQSKNLQVDNLSAGIEFVCDEQAVVVMVHPKLADHLLIEVGLAAEGTNALELPGAALLLLHQVNESARFEHDWVITVGAEGSLQIHCCRPIAAIDVPGLEILMAEGLDRGDSLRALLTTFVDGPVHGDQPGEEMDLLHAAQRGAPILRG